MKRLVVDASVVVSLYFPEPHSEAAERCIAGAKELLAPDLVWAETANVIWKRRRRREVTRDQAAAIVALIRGLPMQITASVDLLSDALDLAVQFGRTVYDCLYLALAVRSGAMLLTADKRLVHALAAGPLKAHVSWVGDHA